MATFRIYLALILLLSSSSYLFCPRQKSRRTASTKSSLKPAITPKTVIEATAEALTMYAYSKHSRISPEERIRAAISPEYRTANSLPLAKSIFISIFCFTSGKICKNLLQAAESGTKITIICDGNQARNRYSKIPFLAASHENIAVYVVKKKTLHTKVMCVEYTDDTTCILEGSYNYTASAKKHEEILDARSDNSHYKKQITALTKLITTRDATPFYDKAPDEEDDSEDDDDDDKEEVRDSSPTTTASWDHSTPFQELLSPRRKPKTTATKPSPCSLETGTLIDTSPITLARTATLLAQKELEATLISHISEAKFICILMYALSSTSIADALIAAHLRGAEIIIIADRLQSTGPSSQIERLRAGGITILRNTSDMMHCKCFIIETLSGEQLVIGGSANASSRVFSGHNIEQSTRSAGRDIFEKTMKLYRKIAAACEPLTTPIVFKTPLAAPKLAPEINATPLVLADSTNKQTRKVSKQSSAAASPDTIEQKQSNVPGKRIRL